MIEEVCDPEIPTGYWEYVMPELLHLEKKWTEMKKKAADAESASADGPKDEETR